MIRMVALVGSLVLAGCGQSEPVPSATVTTLIVVAPSPSAVPPSPVPSASPLAYALSCGPMERVDCEARAATLAAGLAERYPDKTLVSISITASDGDSEAMFDDGTGIMTIHN